MRPREQREGGGFPGGGELANGRLKPMPRPAKSPTRAAEIRVRNRRREYLRRNPAYLADLEHELADPVMYETLVRRFQSRAEKDADAQTKGYSRVLEGDLMRGEAKLAALATTRHEENGDSGEQSNNTLENPLNDNAHLLDIERDDSSKTSHTKEEGRELWDEFLTERFVGGKDPDFDYSPVDKDGSLDTMEIQDAQDAWFDEELPEWASEGEDTTAGPRQGETGIQDF